MPVNKIRDTRPEVNEVREAVAGWCTLYRGRRGGSEREAGRLGRVGVSVSHERRTGGDENPEESLDLRSRTSYRVERRSPSRSNS